ncbi:MAG: class I SAM-dependent methyltransferase [Candidatus Gottesmanbacteria bacterium]|nr:class I SAM-dependent methyltransferase [Candidatus Gottesmanbacteria bacterium]
MLQRCTLCGHICLSMDEEYRSFVDRYYRKEYFTGDQSRAAYENYEHDKPYIQANMRKFLRLISGFKPDGKLLDVGCALGFFVELSQRQGYDAHGIDPSDYAIKKAKKLVGSSLIEKCVLSDVSKRPKSFDVVTMFDVFEHLSDPGKDLETVHALLKDDGIVVIATGDTASIFAKILGRRWTFFSPPQHIHYFNRVNMATLLRKKGFEPVLWTRIGKWLSLRYVLHLARTGGESKIAEYLYRFVNILRLGELPLYLPVRDNMVVIARKKKI